MANPIRNVFYLLLVPLAVLSCLGGSAARMADLREACGATLHRSLCFGTLSPFSVPARQGPVWWARAGVSVTIAATKRARLYVWVLKRSGRVRGRAGYALADCLECLDSALDELGGALGELRRLRRSTFGWQMSNVETWVSAALTDGDTCLDGFAGVGGPQARVLCGMVRNVTYVTSNALALVNRMAPPTRTQKNQLYN